MENKLENDTKSEVNLEEKPTADITTKRTSTKDIIAYLAVKFPACFSVNGPAKPLKIGIFQELVEKLADDETVSKTRLRQALRHYTSSWRYLKSVKLNSFRVDVDGENASEVDQEQANYAAKTLKESQEKFSKNQPKEARNKKPSSTKKVDKNKQSAKNNDKQLNKVKDKEKFKNVKSAKRAQSKVEAKLIPVESSSVSVGKSVKVKLGNLPMDAIITEVSGSDISVQLTSGMVIKTQIGHIFTQ
jgi:ProP effector